MTCDNAQDAIMLYQEKRLSPLKSLALHKHINRCEDCREFFLYMDEAVELDAAELDAVELNTKTELAPEGFTETVMEKVFALPAYSFAKSETPAATGSSSASKWQRTFGIIGDWMRLAGAIYALVLAVGLGFLANTELVEIPYLTAGTGEWADAFFSGIAQMGDQIGMAAASYTSYMAGDFGNYLLAITVVLALALVFVVQREQRRQRVKSFGKKI
jgi:hypothetical protein